MSESDDVRDEIRARNAAKAAAEAAIEAATQATAEKPKKKKRFNRKFKPSKRYRAAKTTRGDRLKKHSVADAIKLVKTFKAAKFDESMELHLQLGVDTKKSDQQVRGTFVFPHGIGQSKRVVCFAEGPAAQQARDAGALEVGGEELAKKIEGGWFDFDVVVAHPGMMRIVGRLGKVLGPKKLMPNPKEGSVTPNVGVAVKEFGGGKAKYRVDDGGNLHVVCGKRSFPDQKLEENIGAFLEHVKTLKPTGAKGTFVLGGSISSTMSPGVTVDLGFLAAQ
ncbi:MAG: 50S ribosomal protein L1 [Planctomycetes bacterium]|nr:50S ribosomal protein L1 [Planctomycetota bacterium]